MMPTSSILSTTETNDLLEFLEYLQNSSLAPLPILQQMESAFDNSDRRTLLELWNLIPEPVRLHDQSVEDLPVEDKEPCVQLINRFSLKLQNTLKQSVETFKGGGQNDIVNSKASSQASRG